MHTNSREETKIFFFQNLRHEGLRNLTGRTDYYAFCTTNGTEVVVSEKSKE